LGVVWIFWPNWFALAANPKDSLETDFNEGIKCLEEKDYEAAAALFEKIIKTNPNIPQVYNALGVVYLQQHNNLLPGSSEEELPQDAIAQFEKAVEINPKFSEGYHNLASIYTGKNMPDLGEEYFLKAVESDPKFIKAYLGLGWVYLSQKQKPFEAAEFFKKATEVDPKYADAQYGLAMAYVASGKNELALRPISTLYSLKRNDLAASIEDLMKKTTPGASSQAEPSVAEQPSTTEQPSQSRKRFPKSAGAAQAQ